MKAILVIDMPKSCATCKFTLSHICDCGRLTMGDIWNGTGDFIEGTRRHVSCPFKPMPFPKINEQTKEWKKMSARDRYFYGIGFDDAKFQWNKEIGGEW